MSQTGENPNLVFFKNLEEKFFIFPSLIERKAS